MMGIREETPGPARRIATWPLRRQALYGPWLEGVGRMIINVLKSERESNAKPGSLPTEL